MEHDVRNTLEFYGGNGEDAVSGLMRWLNMSFWDAVDSVKASGGKLEPERIEFLRKMYREPKRAARSE